MAQTAAGKLVRIQSSWFRSGYAHGVSGVNKGIMPSEPTEQAVLSVVPSMPYACPAIRTNLTLGTLRDG